MIPLACQVRHLTNCLYKRQFDHDRSCEFRPKRLTCWERLGSLSVSRGTQTALCPIRTHFAVSCCCQYSAGRSALHLAVIGHARRGSRLGLSDSRGECLVPCSDLRTGFACSCLSPCRTLIRPSNLYLASSLPG
ncbi:hypothetical protein FA95DRAFT_566602 [Auriscalpium vulgare]|uniref:Uncharacterized protein n=1 Tax=Auriscalpium vulgare TaxID=40419 RepID=A0ACB8S454_9AGAM|nr:hypothetical protein FA95DRAFT_566602 [Auriscalpium vulgare]